MDIKQLKEEIKKETMFLSVVRRKLVARGWKGERGETVANALAQVDAKMSVLGMMEQLLNDDVVSLHHDPNDRSDRHKIVGGIGLDMRATVHPFCVVVHNGDEKLSYAIDAILKNPYPEEIGQEGWWIANRDEAKKFRQEKVE